MKLKITMLVVLLTVAELIANSCSQGKTEQVVLIPVSEKQTLLESFEAFNNPDENIVERWIANSKQVLESQGEDIEGMEAFCRENIAHVDSVIGRCKDYIFNDNWKKLIETFEIEQTNFMSHPSYTTTNDFNLAMDMLNVYNHYYSDAGELKMKACDLLQPTFDHFNMVISAGGQVDEEMYNVLSKLLGVVE